MNVEEQSNKPRRGSASGSSDSTSSSNFTEFSHLECCKYITFLMIFTTIAVLGRGLGESNYFITQQISKNLRENAFIPTNPLGVTQGEKQLVDVDQYFEIYDYLIQIALPTILVNQLPSNELTSDYALTNFVAGQNKVLGGIRLRQLRVKREKCVHTSKQWTCFPSWSSSHEQRDVIYNKYNNNTYEWTSEEHNHEHSYWVGILESYPGSGYVIDLPLNQSLAIKQIEQLRTDNFIDRATRLIVSDFTTYNPILNLHCISRIAFELGSVGGVMAQLESKAWRFFRYEETRGTVLMTFEILFVLFVFYFTFEEIYEVKTKGWVRYKQDKWNIVDILNLIFFYITIVMRIHEISHAEHNELLSANEFHSFRDTQRRFEYEAYMQMVNGFLLYLKMFKYMTFSNRVRFLFAMLQRSSNDLFIFSIVLMVVFMAFGMVGFLAFSSDVNDFRSLHHSVVNLVRFTVAEPPYQELVNSNKSLGSIFFVVWGILMLLILANVFIAILSDAYAVIADEIEDDDQEILSKIFGAPVFQKLTQKWKAFRNADTNADGKLSTNEIIDAIDVSQNKANELIEKYDQDNDGQLDQQEYENLVNDKRESAIVSAFEKSPALARALTQKFENANQINYENDVDVDQALDRIEQMLESFKNKQMSDRIEQMLQSFKNKNA